MAGMRPFFLTGANAKIRVNNKVLAYVTDVSYTVNVNHATPTVLGMYEPSSVEPLSYLVTGQFTVARYVADITDDTGTRPHGVAERGNGIGSWGPESFLQKLGAGFDVLKGIDGRAYDNLDPSRLQKAAMFNIEIYQKFEGGGFTGQRSVANIRDARITRADFRLTKKANALQTFNFTALYVDEDSFLADFSGFGQQFS
jgi:hypothetical protein